MYWEGHIINIASVFGIKMFAPGGTVYCATKAAVRALTEGLRMELHSQYPLHDDFAWRDCHRTVGEQLGRGDEKEFTRVHENGHPGKRDREGDCLRNRAAGRCGSR